MNEKAVKGHVEQTMSASYRSRSAPENGRPGQLGRHVDRHLLLGAKVGGVRRFLIGHFVAVVAVLGSCAVAGDDLQQTSAFVSSVGVAIRCAGYRYGTTALARNAALL